MTITKKKLEGMTLQERQELVQYITDFGQVIADSDCNDMVDIPKHKRMTAKVYNVPRGLIGIIRQAVYEAEKMRTPRFTPEYISEGIESKFGVQMFG